MCFTATRYKCNDALRFHSDQSRDGTNREDSQKLEAVTQTGGPNSLWGCRAALRALLDPLAMDSLNDAVLTRSGIYERQLLDDTSGIKGQIRPGTGWVRQEL